MVFTTFFNLSLNFAIRSSRSEQQSAPGPVYAEDEINYEVNITFPLMAISTTT